jgi:hypothetical protein
MCLQSQHPGHSDTNLATITLQTRQYLSDLHAYAAAKSQKQLTQVNPVMTISL